MASNQEAAGCTWWGGPAFPLGTLHHVLGHPFRATLLPLLLHQLLQLRPAGVGSPLVGGANDTGASHHRLQHRRRWGGSAAGGGGCD